MKESRWSRRALLSLVPGAALAQLRPPDAIPAGVPDARRYLDPSTEFPVTRLTSPSYSSTLPRYFCRAIGRRSNYLLFASDRFGSPQVLRMDLKTLQARAVSEAAEINPHLISLLPDERGYCYFDGNSLMLAPPGGGKGRALWQVSPGYEPGDALAVADDSQNVAVVERNGSRHRLVWINLKGGSPKVLVECEEALSEVSFRPVQMSLAYRRGEAGLWTCPLDGEARELRKADGRIRSLQWNTDGQALVYLHLPEAGSFRSEIREVTPQGEDKLVARTSQYIQFSRNADGTVLAAASGSKAAPYVLIMVRRVRRELALCEHKASDPERVSIRFTPNSQRVLFGSDRDGKPALYLMNVERLVEETESGSAQ
ncbi:MAG: oligogalacturonate lyase family protein [Bryobacteraceae bacterium]|nr:oligogalacturonate lyase family protein [Bryobacteraceae bacterium]